MVYVQVHVYARMLHESHLDPTITIDYNSALGDLEIADSRADSRVCSRRRKAFGPAAKVLQAANQ